MKRKIITAAGIFTVIFTGSWWANENNEVRYNLNEPDDQIQLLMVGEEPQVERFKPREYIKIKR